MHACTQVNCNSQVGAYHRIKEALGEVRESTIILMEKMNLEGVYEISAAEDGRMLNNANEAIRLRMKTNKETDRKVYDLDRLQELQSKLLLVCGNKHDTSGGGVDKFLEVGQ